MSAPQSPSSQQEVEEPDHLVSGEFVLNRLNPYSELELRIDPGCLRVLTRRFIFGFHHSSSWRYATCKRVVPWSSILATEMLVGFVELYVFLFACRNHHYC